MRIDLIRGAMPYGFWLTAEHMIEDMTRGDFTLQPGDKFLVTGDVPAQAREEGMKVAKASHLKLVEKPWSEEDEITRGMLAREDFT